MTSSGRRMPDNGFTLVELMVTVAVMSILLVVGIPNFKSFVLNQRVKTTAYELVASLNYARSEAIKQNRNAVLQGMDINGSRSWVLQINGADLRTFVIPTNVDIDVPVSSITFGPDGRSTASAVFVICDQAGSAAVTSRRIRLDVSGRPSLTRGSDCDS